MSEEKPFDLIGPYRIQDVLGKGGMGVVYRAVHETLERPAAVKLLSPQFLSSPEHIYRFLREARSVASLRHDHIVQVYDAGSHQGRYYIAMELVNGQSLAKLIEDQGALDIQLGLDLMLQATRGLAAAHAKALIHRDIKPENLLINSEGILRIVDFGLVLESANHTQLTAAGAYLGTPMYMSPEQVDGEKADARSDLYALGVTFFCTLVGQPPFASNNTANLMFKHMFEAPLPPLELRPDLPENVCNLLLRLMAKDPDKRPQSANELQTLIEEVKAGKKIDAPTPVPALRPAQSESRLRQAEAIRELDEACGVLVKTPEDAAGTNAKLDFFKEKATAALHALVSDYQRVLSELLVEINDKSPGAPTASRNAPAHAAFQSASTSEATANSRSQDVNVHAEVGQVPAGEKKSSSGRLNALRILLVEDDADTRDLVTMVLAQQGAEVTPTASVREALDAFATARPDVVVSDIMMPDEDGCALIDKIRALKAEQGGRTPAVALTACTRPDERARLLSAGFQLHVPKPFEPSDLAIAVANVVSQNSGQESLAAR